MTDSNETENPTPETNSELDIRAITEGKPPMLRLHVAYDCPDCEKSIKQSMDEVGDGVDLPCPECDAVHTLNQEDFSKLQANNDKLGKSLDSLKNAMASYQAAKATVASTKKQEKLTRGKGPSETKRRQARKQRLKK